MAQPAGEIRAWQPARAGAARSGSARSAFAPRDTVPDLRPVDLRAVLYTWARVYPAVGTAWTTVKR